MLNSHPEIFCTGAGRFVGWTYSVGAWLQEENFRTWAAFHTIRDQWLRDITPDEAMRLVKRAMIEAVMSLKWKPGIRLLGDKTPMFYCVAADDLHQLFPEAKIICVIRDGRDVCVSHMFHILRREEYQWFRDEQEGHDRRKHFVEGEGPPCPLFTPETLSFFAQNWVRSMEGARRAKELCGPRYMDLKYEAMLEDTERVVTQVFEFLGVSTETSIVRRAVEENSFERKSGGRRPGQADPLAFVRKGIAGDWKNYFSDDDKALFKRVAGHMLVELGYEKDLRW